MQEVENGRKKIIAVASHSFNATEQNWSTTEREAYAIKWATSKFDYFLRNRPFVILTDHRSLTYLDHRIFNNAKIRRWQEEISDYKFIMEFVEGESNVWADMLSRSHGQQKNQNTCRSYTSEKRIPGRGIRPTHLHPILVSGRYRWSTTNSQDSLITRNLLSLTHRGCVLCIPFYIHHSYQEDLRSPQYSSRTIKRWSTLSNHSGLSDNGPGQRMSYGPQRPSDFHLQETYQQILFGTRYFRPDGQRHYTLTKVDRAIQTLQQIFISGIWLHQPLRHHSHEGTPIQLFKNRDIKTYVNSWSTCARCKGNYGKRVHWPIDHCKQGKRPFDLFFIDFVTIPNSKGKHYILAILDGFIRYFTAIICTRDYAIDAARGLYQFFLGLYQFFLGDREIARIVSSDCGTHFTGEVYRQFCNQMSITQELHCPWRPQSSGNIEWQHRTMKNALYMLCEDRNCEWTDVLESVVSSMNATITVLLAYPTLHNHRPTPQHRPAQITREGYHPGAYGIQINALLRQVHHCVAPANDEADHKLEVSLNHNATLSTTTTTTEIIWYPYHPYTTTLTKWVS